MDELQLVKNGMKRLRLRDLRGVSAITKIPETTLIKIYYGTTKYPRFPTLKTLAEYFGRAA